MESNCTCVNGSIARQIMNLQEASQNNNHAGDATWILTSAFIIFTMQSGFGLLESGSCSMKNGCNIMIKNAVDVIFGALGYYVCGFGLSFGQGEYANGFTGFGDFFPDTSDDGWLFAKYFFQLSFATTATTIVSGAMAERTNLKAYMLFSFLNLFSYVFPAHWIWDDIGFLKVMGVVDIAGCGPVHVVGGVSALLATLLLQPRLGIFDETNPKSYHMASPTNMVLGTFMLWWGWLGFNCGSTFGVSGGKWMLASRAAVNTVNGSVGGGMFSIVYSYYLTNQYKGKLDVAVFTSGILAGLVSVTGICAICRPWEALIIGTIGGIICTYGSNLVKFLHIDDPVNCIPVHLLCGTWGLISIGLFGEEENKESLSRYNGIFKGGSPIFLAKQLLAVVCIGSWAAVTTIIELFIADRLIGLRMSEADELLGADIIEHGIHFENRCQESEIKKEKQRKRSNAMRKKLSDTGTNCGADVTPSSYYSEGMINFGFVSFNESSCSSVDGKLKRIKEEVDEEEIEREEMKNDFTFEQVVEKEIKESKIENHKAIRKTSKFEILHLRRSNTVT